MPVPCTVVLDPEEVLGLTISLLEDQFRFIDPDNDRIGRVLDRAIEVAANLGMQIFRAAALSRTYLAPDGHSELSPLLLIDGDLSGSCQTLREGIDLIRGEFSPYWAAMYVERSARSVTHSAGPDGQTLVALAVNPPARRVLSRVQYSAYVRYARATFTDPLQRFAVIPPGTTYLAAPPPPRWRRVQPPLIRAGE